MLWAALFACSDVPVEAPPQRVGAVKLLVVLDTVRADHLSACGYARPTSPVLSELVARGGALRCDVLAPGSWTLPSHATFFTGTSLLEHGARFVPPDQARMTNTLPVGPLGDDATTLAEQLSDEGWATVAVSGNPVVSEGTGLLQGFQLHRSAEKFRHLDGVEALGAVEELVGAVPPEQDLFLFVNFAEAHAPWPEIGPGHPWLPPRASAWSGVRSLMGSEVDASTWAETMAHHTDLYDEGIRRANQSLGALLGWLEGAGRLGAGAEVVVTSDHGEFLGEHGLVSHGRYLWEPNQRVFTLHWVVGGRSRSEGSVHQLLGGGSPGLPMETVAFPDSQWQGLTGGRFGVHRSAAIWGARKVLWTDGEVQAFDLAADPEEQQPLAATAAEVAAVNALAARMEELEVEPLSVEGLEALRAAGYVE